MDPQTLTLFFAWFIVFLFSTTLHEAGHAFAARRLGDDTAYRGGQVSLNPWPHIRREPFGMVIVPILTFFMMGGNWMIGWASAPYDPNWAARYPRKSALMSLAGPVANLLLLSVAAIGIRVGLATGFFVPQFVGFSQIVGASTAAGSAGAATVLSILFGLNLVLFIFNLMPLPPLDGSGVVQLFLPPAMARGLQSLFHNPMWSMIGILAAWRVFPVLFNPLYEFCLRLLYTGVAT